MMLEITTSTFNLGDYIQNLMDENIKLKHENKELNEDIEDLLKTYVQDIQNFKSDIYVLEKELDDCEEEMYKLISIIEEQNKKLDNYHESSTEHQLTEYERWLESENAEELIKAYNEQGF